MDWVKPKSERTKRNGEGIKGDAKATFPKAVNADADPTGKNSAIAATAWLEQLCHENVAYLQQSLPVALDLRKKKELRSSIRRMANAIQWGAGTLEFEVDEGPDVLDRLLQVYASQPLLKVDLTNPKMLAANELRIKTSENIARWIARSLPNHGSDSFVALVSVSWVHGLRELGNDLPPSLWLEVLQSILTQVDRAWNERSPKQLLPWLIWACEVPLALATQLSQLGRKDRMVIETLDRLALLLEASSDDPTLWIQNGCKNLRALLATVVRARWAADALEARPWYAPQRKAIAQLTKVALSVTHHDGKPLLVDPELGADDKELWTSIAELCLPNKNLESLYATIFPKRTLAKGIDSTSTKSKSKRATKKLIAVRLPEPGMYFEKAELATMRRDWQHNGVRIAVDYARDPMWIDCLGAGGQRLISGEWDIIINKDGHRLDTDVGWSDVCWFSDDDVDYLEIESAVEGVCRIQRQIMLIREEGLMFFSDTLLANETGHWSIESSWELSPGVDVRSAVKSHEAELVVGSKQSDRCGLLMPLALPEWRRQPSTGKLYGEAGKLVLHQEVEGTRIYSPLVLATRKQSRQQPFTWRRLTVAQDLKNQPSNVAQAYRVQIGKEQVVFYRSLAKVVRRTAMGLHLNSEFYAGRFDSDDAEFESIVEINAEE
ncbi:MAG: hypothetical protein SGI77_08740 [Pirellulaceae bacterium]|nr:hypothetical protein [Pirellulaceae bacterium]